MEGVIITPYKTRGVECASIRRAIGVREATAGVRGTVMLGPDLLVVTLLLLPFLLFNVVRSYDGEILITVETCDNGVLPVKLLCW